jgi:hypothetical protein
MIGVTDLIAGIFKPAAGLIDDLHTSEEERLAAKTKMLEVQAAAMQRVFDYETQALTARATIVNSVKVLIECLTIWYRSWTAAFT